jgi:hypothetical protein
MIKYSKIIIGIGIAITAYFGFVYVKPLVTKKARKYPVQLV